MDRMRHRLVHDEIEELVSSRHIFGFYPRARVRIFEPHNDHEPAIVVCSELADNPGASVTGAADAMATQVRDRYLKGRAIVWVEHYPSEARGGWPERSTLRSSKSFLMAPSALPGGSTSAASVWSS